jgi:hypothetical protein
VNVSIIVPFNGDGAQRDRNWAYLRQRYETLYPDWEIVVGTCEPPWRKGRAVNAAVEASSGDVLVISDADVLIAESALRDAVERLETNAWVVPHRMVYRLTEDATKAVLENRVFMAPDKINRNLERVRRGAPGGGIAVTRREDFPGMDERFEGWGGEDMALAFALDTLVGPHLRLDQILWHLYHEPLPMRPGINGSRGRGSDDSEALAERYRQACGDSVAMSELVTESHQGMQGGGIIVTSREVYERVPLDPRFEGWGQEDECFGLALRTLAGPPRRGTAELVHLHHPSPERISRARGNQAGWDLRSRYVQARNRPDRMNDLVKEALVYLDSPGNRLHDRQAL